MAFPPLLYSQNNQTWNNGGPACTDITLQMMITSLKLDHVVNVHGFLSTFISPIKTKFGMMVDQHAFFLPSMYDNINTTRSRDQRLQLYLHFYKTGNIQMSQQERPASADLTLQVMMTLLQPSWVISVFAFIPTSISSITTKLGRMTDLLNLPCRR